MLVKKDAIGHLSAIFPVDQTRGLMSPLSSRNYFCRSAQLLKDPAILP